MQYVIEPEELFPGEDGQLSGKLSIDYDRGESSVIPVYSQDPLYVPNLERVLHHSLKREKFTDQGASKVLNIASKTHDCFALMPMEMVQSILLHLPSRDVLKVKLASSVFASTPLPETFWASRFQRGFEFHCVFEARSCAVKTCCWKTLYYGVKHLQNSLSFRNRRRIWVILLRLEGPPSKLSSTSLYGFLSRSFFEADRPEDCMQWNVASGALKGPMESYAEGCRALWTRTAVVPSSLVAIFVTLIDFNDVHYVSGLRFRQQRGDDVCLGYIISKNEISMEIDALLNSQNGCSISGFHLAIDPRGIRAISVLTCTGRMSKWLGHPGGIPQTRLLARKSTLLSLKGGFDASTLFLHKIRSC